MKIHQLSLFLENIPGQVHGVCRTLKDAGIDIRALCVADASEFGILRLIVSNWRAAADVLSASGNIVNTTEVLAVEAPDRPGGLIEFLDVLERGGVNIDYMYTQTFGQSGRAVLICRFDNIDRAIECLDGSGINVVAPVDVYRP